MTDVQYSSFSYLTAGEDYDEVELAPQVGRTPPYDLGLTEEQQERTRRLMAENLIISVHDHPHVFPDDMGRLRDYARAGRTALGYEGLRRSGMDCVFENLAGPTGCITSAHGWKWSDVLFDIGMRVCDIDHQSYVVLARTVADILEAKRQGRMALVLGIEAATPIENELDRLDLLYGFGVRQVGIVYNDTNLLGSGLKELRDGGLSRFGRRAVKRMNDLGMSIDLSHAGDRTSIEVIEASERPVMITHAGARGVWPSERMKPDHVLTALAESGGLLGIEAAPHSTVSPAHPEHSIDSVMDHMLYCVDLMGIDAVTFGPDTLFGDHAGLHTTLAGVFGKGGPSVPQADPDPGTRVGVTDPVAKHVEYCAGLENPGENFWNIVGWLVKHGFADEDIAKLCGGNTLRVLERSWWA
ncbi:dipeptidase [Actinomadura scrupuli]|uniref:dipeptidase n=1 Tax=Actinomadura scrupuli TaxID=559629 RepID=UPI003D954996